MAPSGVLKKSRTPASVRGAERFTSAHATRSRRRMWNRLSKSSAASAARRALLEAVRAASAALPLTSYSASTWRARETRGRLGALGSGPVAGHCVGDACAQDGSCTCSTPASRSLL